MGNVIVRQETVTIPTYEIAKYDKNPMFLEKRVYQGSSGRVYPHPVCEGVSDEKTDKQYKAVFLENDYILVMILPELGGRIQRLLDKTNGYDAVYYNEVIKPALVGLAGPWISGGIEFNWPQHHRPSTYDEVDITIVNNSDGSVTVWVGETEKMFHTKGAAGFTVYPDKAYLEITGKLYNPTDRPQTFLWWANPAVSVNDYTRSIFPPDVNAVMDHGKRDVSKFPIADGVYYKVDYAPGTDISRYKNIPVPTSYMAYHSDFDFIGNYDDSKEAGLLHIANHHISPGKKQWTWGNGDFGRAWDRNLTDENGPYIELMTGMFTDNQPDFTFLKPYEEKNFRQLFMPYKKAGAVKNANDEYAINVERTEKGISVCVYAMADLMDKEDNLLISVSGKNKYTERLALSATSVYEKEIETNASEDEIEVYITRNGKKLLTVTKVKNTEPIPKPADPIPAPSEIATNEELFLDGMHLEQYRHATYNPADYYLEGLRRDPQDIRINNAYGKLLYNKGLFKESIPYFEAAIKRSTFKNPNPYDCEPFFNLGLALMRTGEADKAYGAFYKATWDGNMQDKAFYKLACIDASKGEYEMALEHIEASLVRNLHNMKARTLKTYILRALGNENAAKEFAMSTVIIDPLDMGARYELSVMNSDHSEWLLLMRGDNSNFVELALTYMEAGLFEEAAKILDFAPQNEPMAYYYKYMCTNDPKELIKAEKADSLYCFPNRIDDILVLENAVSGGALMAAYYLGCLFYDKGEWQKSVSLWESVIGKISLPTLHRNLSLAYFNKLHDFSKAKEQLDKAFSMDETDARVFFELDQLLKITDADIHMRKENLEKHKELLPLRDDLYTEYMAVLNACGEHEKAYNLMMEHKFHPWEGGEGKITGEYRKALIGMAEREASNEKACELLNRALSYPENLGEGKLIGAMDNDIYYLLGERTVNETEKENYYKLASRGEMNLSSAMYYNDQPPEMMYFRSLSIGRLGNKEMAKACFEEMIDYGNCHMEDSVKIDFFAVSLPDFLIFEGDLNKRNKKHCENMIMLGKKGLTELAR